MRHLELDVNRLSFCDSKRINIHNRDALWQHDSVPGAQSSPRECDQPSVRITKSAREKNSDQLSPPNAVAVGFLRSHTHRTLCICHIELKIGWNSSIAFESCKLQAADLVWGLHWRWERTCNSSRDNDEGTKWWCRLDALRCSQHKAIRFAFSPLVIKCFRCWWCYARRRRSYVSPVFLHAIEEVKILVAINTRLLCIIISHYVTPLTVTFVRRWLTYRLFICAPQYCSWSHFAKQHTFFAPQIGSKNRLCFHRAYAGARTTND